LVNFEPFLWNHDFLTVKDAIYHPAIIDRISLSIRRGNLLSAPSTDWKHGSYAKIFSNSPKM